MFKKAILFIFLAVSFSACGQTVMDLPAKDGNYHYENFDFSFTADLPPIFEYYQTQRRAEADWTDVEFFLPTNDPEYIEAEFPSYWQPLTVRVWNREAHAATLVPGVKPAWQEFGSNRDYVHTYLLEANAPEDWRERWTDEAQQSVVENLRVK